MSISAVFFDQPFDQPFDQSFDQSFDQTFEQSVWPDTVPYPLTRANTAQPKGCVAEINIPWPWPKRLYIFQRPSTYLPGRHTGQIRAVASGWGPRKAFLRSLQCLHFQNLRKGAYIYIYIYIYIYGDYNHYVRGNISGTDSIHVRQLVFIYIW
jgi:hypothetical protein